MPAGGPAVPLPVLEAKLRKRGDGHPASRFFPTTIPTREAAR
jgi:hypothetical protein